jgi:oligoribonuclease (3'-5' exoribonuclease)
MLKLQIIYFKFTATDVIDIKNYADRYKPEVVD